MVTYKIGERFTLYPKNGVQLIAEQESCSANIDFPTFGLDTKRYTPLDFIILFMMMSFFMFVSICSIGLSNFNISFQIFTS